MKPKLLLPIAALIAAMLAAVAALSQQPPPAARTTGPGIQTGADAFINKPFEASMLRARVRNLLDQKHRLLRSSRLHTSTERAVEPTRAGSLESSLRSYILAHLQDESLSVQMLAGHAALSESQLRRRLREDCGMSPTRLIRTVRAEEARRLLESADGTISEIAYAVGFNSLAYFNRSFRERFSLSPSEYVRIMNESGRTVI